MSACIGFLTGILVLLVLALWARRQSLTRGRVWADRHVVGAFVIAIVVGALFVSGCATSPHPVISVPPVAALTLPLVLHTASGAVQVYTCREDGTWDEKSAPHAELLDANGQIVAHHSPDPRWDEPNGWVKGNKLAAYPVAGAIPELDLEVIERGYAGLASPFGGAEMVRRRHTSGGLKPQGPCDPGEKRAVEYGATYIFE